MREKFRQFMIGRYGTDSLGNFLLGTTFFILFINIFLRLLPLTVLEIVLLFLCYCRIFSKNHRKRYAENIKFLQIKNRFVLFFKKKKAQAMDRKVNRIFKCPTCNQKIRIPKGKGRISITCPKCRTEFEKRS